MTGLVLHSAATASAQTSADTEAELWGVIKDSKDTRFFTYYLLLFPDGAHAGLAEERRSALEREDAVAAAKAAHSNIVELRARHILVRDEAEAEEIIEELKGGADFAKLARSRSIDTTSGEAGGDLGWFSRNTMVQEFADAAFAMKPGEFSKVPVKTQFGYHVILVEEARYLQE
ncbi:peptidylprolyl isomerase [Dongia sp.]|uniref:peptidylprolyl isomerase n=1 Tax=Dongia sp. TaxID=1977262 RepID=UPI003752EE32